MDFDRLYQILAETTQPMRVDEDTVKTEQMASLTVITVDLNPTEAEASNGLKVYDFKMLKVGVDVEKAELLKDELVTLMRTYPDLSELSRGPSYITVGAQIGSQGAAFQLFALGDALGMWKILMPADIGAPPERHMEMIGSGFVLITPWSPPSIH